MPGAEDSPLLPQRSPPEDDDDAEADPGKSTNNTVILIIIGVLAAIFVTVRVLPKAKESEVFMAQQDKKTGGLEIVRVRSSDNAASDGVAFGEFIYNPDPAQWSYLTLETAKDVSDPDGFLHSMYGLGFIEGALTCTAISNYYHNFASTINGGAEVSDLTKTFVAENWEWTKKEAVSKSSTDPFWLHVHGIVNQVEGMLDGFLKCQQTDLSVMSLELRKDVQWAVDSKIDTLSLDEPTILQFLLVSGNGDLFQIMSVSDKIEHMRGAHRDPEDAAENGGLEDTPIPQANGGGELHVTNTTNLAKVAETPIHASGSSRRATESAEENVEASMASLIPDHCSALIKAAPDFSDVYFAHTTWDSYSNSAPRIFKRYHMRTPEGQVQMYFSSSPGMMSSVDDFYTVNGLRYDETESSSLAVIETSIDVFNLKAIQSIVPESLLSWVRVRVANQLSSNGGQWAQNFETHFSGTYANQWMVQDLNMFQQGAETADDALWDTYLTVLEEVPGLVIWQDVTKVLRDNGYWASYNMPYFKDIAARTGAAARCAINPDECHDTAPRALQFAEQEKAAASVRGMMEVISYNDFKNDPISLDNACRAISCREDLELIEKDKRAFGAIDAKVSSAKLSKRDLSKDGSTARHFVRLGPTQHVSHEQSPFCWSQYTSPPADENGILSEQPDEVNPWGHPDCFDGSWQEFPPYLASPGWLVN